MSVSETFNDEIAGSPPFVETHPLPLPTRIAFIGNYLPRQCGIATFTTDLCTAIAAIRPHAFSRSPSTIPGPATNIRSGTAGTGSGRPSIL